MKEDILQALTENHTIDKLICREETTSTNDLAKQLAAEHFQGKALAIAEIQTAGRGRMGRHWESPAGSGIWMSLLFRPSRQDLRLSSVTLLAALAIASALNSCPGNSEDAIGIKWPNDVILHGKKLSGILTEMITEGTENYIISGIGINVNTASFPPELQDKATSLYLETGKTFHREPLAIRIIENLVSYEADFEKDRNLERFVPLYDSLLVSKDREVVLSAANLDFPDNPYIARGIDRDGALIVEDRHHRRTAISSGEISVRGVLGYV